MNTKKQKTFIDASLFMGMHSVNEKIRRQSLWFMSTYFSTQVFMNLEQVGMCDEYVWQYDRSVQDAYYPFMDVLHSEMDVKRVGYRDEDLNLLYIDSRFEGLQLTLQKKLLLAQVINQKGILYTHDEGIRSIDCFQELLGEFNEKSNEQIKGKPLFSTLLDTLYETSRSLIFPLNSAQQGSGDYAK